MFFDLTLRVPVPLSSFVKTETCGRVIGNVHPVNYYLSYISQPTADHRTRRMNGSCDTHADSQEFRY